MLSSFWQHSWTATEAAAPPGLSRSRLYLLSSDYLPARARKKEDLWIPGTSGGDHTAAWPEPVIDLLRKRLACSPPCPYGFVASEALRLHAFKLDRAQVRHWAIQNGCAHPAALQRPQAPVRRWQRSQIGELWPLDASPHGWFPSCALDFPMLNMLDDGSRWFVGSKVYDRERLLSYLDFLPAAFLAYGRPLQIYVDYHAMFFTQNPDAPTQLGWSLKFYDISFLYAPTPQAKGKIERAHPFWQGRLPPFFASEHIHEIEEAHPPIDSWRLHHNAHEIHRELPMTPQQAWDQARKEKRSVLRPIRRCPWWPYVWSVRTTLKVGSEGPVPIGPQRFSVEHSRGAKVILGLHPTGPHSVLAAPPNKKRETCAPVHQSPKMKSVLVC